MKRFNLASLIVLGIGLILCVVGILLATGPGLNQPVYLPESDLPMPRSDHELLAMGDELVKQHNCNFCHRTEVPSDKTHVARDNCQSCHQYSKRPENLAPPLETIAERRTDEWIRRYLRYPYPIRQNSNDRMPDLGLTDREVEILTRYLVFKAKDGIESLPDWRPEREDTPDPARLAAGRALWDQFNCAQCHTLGDEVVKPTWDENGNPHLMPVIFAPALDKTWTRTRPEWLAEGIQHPAKRIPWSGMLQTNITQEQARELAWYITNAIPPPKRTVAASEVVDVMRRRCNGCHYAPDPDASFNTNPQGGAGWLATWGDKPRKLDLMSIEGIMRGAVDDFGNPRPSVIPYAENSPLLMHIKGLKHPHMPFGMNPLPPEEIKLIQDWILSGAPVPKDTGGIKVNPPIEMGD